jgi:hypothetical protein
LVLLEIFDLYRQSFVGNKFDAERAWNNRNGWFNLAHVCCNWRRVILASPSRLRVRLYFAHNTPTRAVALERLSQVPIVVDYSSVTWDANAVKRLNSALRYPNRVCRIVIKGSYRYGDKLSETLDVPFTTLESLEISGIGCTELAASLLPSVHSLRHLKLFRGNIETLLPVLSVTRALVDLNLGLYTIFCETNEASLLTHLQHMPQLRNLQVSTFVCSEESPPTTTVLLAELTCLRLDVQIEEIEWFISGLAAPSLREFHISISAANESPTLHIPHLSRFIHAAGISFSEAHFYLGSNPTTFLYARSHSIDGPPSKTVGISSVFTPRSGGLPSAILATLEDIHLSISTTYPRQPLPEDLAPWGEFFQEFRNVKVLRLSHGIEARVADILRRPTVNPPPSQEVLPSLEEIVVYAKPGASGLKSFVPFAAARQEVGRPVKVIWSTDGSANGQDPWDSD